MIALTRRQRSLVLFFSASGYIAWFSGLGERLDAQGIIGTPVPALTLGPRAMPPRVASVIRRDPFAGAPERPDDQPPARTAGPGMPGMPANGPGGVVPNPAGAVPDPGMPAGTTIASVASDTRSAGPTLTLVVRATIIGPNPVAYVANGRAMDIVRVGDRLGDRRVAKIDLRGLAFSDGSRLDLPGNFDATPAPRREAGGVTIRLDDLRALLGVARPHGPLASPARASAGATAAPTPAPAGTFPTPGPLPTVNQRGIPVGTNPTFDPTAPTPYPEPYPYAPPVRRP